MIAYAYDISGKMSHIEIIKNTNGPEESVQVERPNYIKLNEFVEPVIGYEVVSILNTDLSTDGFLH